MATEMVVVFDDGTEGITVTEPEHSGSQEPAVVKSGPAGPRGADGAAGAAGTPGAASTVPGPKGDKGDKGDTGNAGAASTVPGPPGADSTVPGPPGADGQPGAKGDKGDKGDTGEKGDQGEPGSQGPPGSGSDELTLIETPAWAGLYVPTELDAFDETEVAGLYIPDDPSQLVETFEGSGLYTWTGPTDTVPVTKSQVEDLISAFLATQGLSTEQIQDLVGQMFVGTGVEVTYNDDTGQVTIAADGGVTPNDIIGTINSDGNGTLLGFGPGQAFTLPAVISAIYDTALAALNAANGGSGGAGVSAMVTPGGEWELTAYGTDGLYLITDSAPEPTTLTYALGVIVGEKVVTADAPLLAFKSGPYWYTFRTGRTSKLYDYQDGALPNPLVLPGPGVYYVNVDPEEAGTFEIQTPGGANGDRLEVYLFNGGRPVDFLNGNGDTMYSASGSGLNLIQFIFLSYWRVINEGFQVIDPADALAEGSQPATSFLLKPSGSTTRFIPPEMLQGAEIKVWTLDFTGTLDIRVGQSIPDLTYECDGTPHVVHLQLVDGIWRDLHPAPSGGGGSYAPQKTGKREVSASFDSGALASSTAVFLERIDDLVIWTFPNTNFTGVATRIMSTIPAGFWPEAGIYLTAGVLGSQAGTARLLAYEYGFINMDYPQNGYFAGTLIYTTGDPWPSSLPGTAV